MTDEPKSLGKRVLSRLNLRQVARSAAQVVADDVKSRIRGAALGADTADFEREVDSFVDQVFEGPAPNRTPAAETDALRPWMVTLGVAPPVTLDEARSAYRILAKAYHPDNPKKGDREKFQRVREAWEQAQKDLPHP